jgi:hypothetical protein
MKKQGLFLKLSVFLLVLLSVPLCHVSASYSAIYYVAATGNDSHDGSISSPWASVAKASATMVAGDTVYIRGGIYSEREIHISTGGSQDKYITFSGYPGEMAIIDGGYDASSSGRHPIFWIDASYIKILNLTIQHGSMSNIHIGYYANVNNVLIEGCDISNVVTDDNTGLVYFEAGNTVTEITVSNNKIHDRIQGSQYPNTGDGIKLFRSRNVYLNNNEIYNLVNGIYYKHSDNIEGVTTLIENNLIHDVGIGLRITNDNSLIQNNIIYNASGGIIIFDMGGTCGGDGTRILHNTIALSPTGVSLRAPSDGCAGSTNSVIRNNLFTDIATSGDDRGIGIWHYNAGSDTSNTTIEYNLVYSPLTTSTISVINSWYTVYNMPDTVSGRSNMLAAAPAFVGGSAPVTASGFALATGSPGKNAASDGSDMGANVSLVGPEGYCASHAVTIQGEPNYYTSIAAAYGEAGSGRTILMQAMTFDEALSLNRAVEVTLIGGYDCVFTSNASGYSTISGKVTIGGTGKTFIENLIIK